MKRLMCWFLLPMIAMASAIKPMTLSELKSRTRLDRGQPTGSVYAPWLNQRVSGLDLLGSLDTVGGTTYDWQTNGPSCKYTAFDPAYGTHAVWMWSAEPGSPYSDRNMRYNFHDGSAWQYNIGPDFMQWGLNAFGSRCGYGNLDINPVTGCEYISCHLSGGYPAVSRDLTPGAGVFEIDSGPPGIATFIWPVIGLTASEKVHMGMIDDPANTALYYTNITWPDWLVPPVDVPPPAPEPGFPTEQIATTPAGEKICLTWEVDGEFLPNSAYMRLSLNDGATWEDPVQISYPPTFNPVPGESLGPSFHISSITPFFDTHNNLHLAASVFCAASETTLYVYPVEIWHWSGATSWSRVARAEAESLAGEVGYNAIAATRPTMAEAADGEYVIVWEQFDPLNVEPQTTRLRADVWGARSGDNGATWGTPTRLTDPDECSKRFPSVGPKLVRGDTLVIGYLLDIVAGFSVQDEGPITNNPWVVQRVWKYDLPTSAVAEGTARPPRVLQLTAAPNPFQARTTIDWSLPKTGPVRLAIHDAAGRSVRTLVSGQSNPGRFRTAWDSRDDRGSAIVPGVYFALLDAGGSRLTHKLTMTK